MFRTIVAADEGRIDAVATGRLGWAGLFLLFTYVFLANHWIGDDAYITFRVAWNFVHGYGPTFNPDERVQAFTHPLWFLVVSAAHLVTRELFFTVTALLWGCGVLALAVLVRWARTLPSALLLTVWLLSSKAFVDYTASGLEYPLSYLLLALFYTRFLTRAADVAPTPIELRWFVLLAALGYLNRPDAVLLYAVPVGIIAWQTFRLHGRRRTAGAVLTGLSPAILWTLFALFYYGFPFPNTYYAKVATGIPRPIMIQQGVAYVLNSFSHDPITLGTIGLALVVGWWRRGAARIAALSAALYVLYTINVGGDFMSGRFFAMPFLVAVMTVTPVVATAVVPALAVLAVYTVLLPLVPIKTTDRYDGAWAWRTQNGIKDERGHYHRATNILFFSPFRELPDLTFAREGLSFGAAAEKVAVHGSIGMFGLYAGPRKFVVDRNALSDPLLARLPVSPRLYFEFYASHYFRDLPDGYLESVEADDNRLRDPVLRPYYDRLRHVTRGALSDMSRLADIWWLNAGRGRTLHERFEAIRPIELSIPAGNERFFTDVGERDAYNIKVQTTGRPGYLLYGPRAPLKAGIYQVRWLGIVEDAQAGEIGFVEVWDGSTRLVRRRLLREEVDNQRRVLVSVDFDLARPARAIDYRFFVGANTKVTLERVEISSARTAGP